MTDPLHELYVDEGVSLPERLGAGEVLADFAKGDSDDHATLLADLVLEANPEQFHSVFAALRRHFDAHQDRVRQQLGAELARQPAPRWDDVELADPRPLEPAILARLEDPEVGGRCRDHFAFCQALPLDEFRPIAKAMSVRGYRPRCVRPYAAGGRMLLAAAWVRDGLDWHCELDRTSPQVRAQDEVFRREWLARGHGYLPVDVAAYRAPGAAAGDDARYAALWVAAQRRPAGGLERLEFLDARMYVAVDEASEHRAHYDPLNAAGFVPRTNVKIAGPDGLMWVSSVRWKLRNPPRAADTWDAASWAKVESRVHHQADRALTPVDVRFSWLGPSAGLAYASTWWSGVGFETRVLCDPSPAAGLAPAEHRAQYDQMAADGYRPVGIAAVEVPSERPAGHGPHGRRERGRVRIACASVWRRPLVDQPDKDRLARRQANAAIALFLLGSPDPLRRHLAHSDDPRLRSELIERLAAFEVSPRLLAGHLRSNPPPEPSVRRALLLALASLRADKVPPDLRDALTDGLVALYRDDPDRGIHSAAELVLRQWKLDEVLRRAFDQLPRTGRAPAAGAGPEWFVTPGGDTLVSLPGRIEFTMGSPGDEPLRDHNQEPLQRRRIDRTIAVATKEVTLDQFLRFFPEHPHKTAFGLDRECPVNSVTWYDAARYCNRLSAEEGLEPCYPAQIGPGMVLAPDVLERTGYRLPTEAEWEAFSRAGTRTTWCFGHSASLVSRYAWTVFNSEIQSHPVGRLLPNNFGLFDTVGNVFEWCHDRFIPERPGLCDEPFDPDSVIQHLPHARAVEIVEDGQDRVMRGGSFLYIPLQARSAYRDKNRVNKAQVYLGFRVVRTLCRSGEPRPKEMRP